MSPTQRRILWLMRQHDEDYVACSGHGARLHGFGHAINSEGGLFIRAYSDPLYFMSTVATASGRPEPWLLRVQRNTPGEWWQLTEAGKQAAASIREEPPVPARNNRSHFGAKALDPRQK